MVWTTLIAGLLGMGAPDPGLLATTNAMQAGIEAGYASAVAQNDRPSAPIPAARSLAHTSASSSGRSLAQPARVADSICARDLRAGQGDGASSDSFAGVDCAGRVQLPNRVGAQLSGLGRFPDCPGAIRVRPAAPPRAGPEPGLATENRIAGLNAAPAVCAPGPVPSSGLRFRATDGLQAAAGLALGPAADIRNAGSVGALAQASRSGSAASLAPGMTGMTGMAGSRAGQGLLSDVDPSTKSEIPGSGCPVSAVAVADSAPTAGSPALRLRSEPPPA